ncbi:MAG TPA: dihydrodipicolinate synthase family protein [Rhizobiaceae bacterium]|nr:dihydrodipicolinate synthase family protein [Rhizobiaceae bacterium]
MSKLDETARGVYVIAATPFADNGALDLSSLDSMLDFYLASGVSGITVLGIMGEATKLTAEESSTVVSRILKRLDGKIPVVAGVSSPGLAAMSELTKSVMGEGAAGVMVAPPGSLRTDAQIFGYFRSVADTLGPDVPFVLQDYPLVTGVTIDASVIRRIVDALPTCVMLKHEDWPGLAKISALRSASARDGMRRISILVGNGGLFLPEELARGADGAMTGFAYPEMMVGVCAAHAAGDTTRARDLFDAYLPLARYEQQQGIGLAVRKYVLAKRGAIASATVRTPGPKLSKEEIDEIELLIRRQEKRLAELG